MQKPRQKYQDRQPYMQGSAAMDLAPVGDGSAGTAEKASTGLGVAPG